MEVRLESFLVCLPGDLEACGEGLEVGGRLRWGRRAEA